MVIYVILIKVIWGMISYERILRMEAMLRDEVLNYEYIPVDLIQGIVERFLTIKTPRYNESILFEVYSVCSIVSLRNLVC